MKYISNSLEETEKIAKDFVENLNPKNQMATVVGLYGNLGAGKTTFTQLIAKAFGINETVTSPTFVIEKIYELKNQKFSKLVHIDAYRLNDEKELLHLGWEEVLADSNNIILIEWPERVENIMPLHIRVNLSHISPNSREIEIIK